MTADNPVGDFFLAVSQKNWNITQSMLSSVHYFRKKAPDVNLVIGLASPEQSPLPAFFFTIQSLNRMLFHPFISAHVPSCMGL